MFNPQKYWEDRHNKYKGNLLSVGNLANIKKKNCDEIEEKAKETIQNKIFNLLKSENYKKNNKIFDYGCGIGRIYSKILDINCEYYGYDFSKTAIIEAKKIYPKGNFFDNLNKICDMKIKFDFILCNYVFVHIVDDNELIEQLSILKSLLKNNGKIIILDQFKTNDSIKNLKHIKKRDINEMKYIINKCNLKLKDYILGSNYIIVYK